MKLKDGTEYRMNPKHKEIWLGALRSGKYRQRRNILGHGAERCVLGVCVAEKLTRHCFGAYVPKAFLHSEAQKTVGTMNDTGKKFSVIAKWIEENL